VLEGCMGQSWTPGLASKFVSDIASPEYKLVARGPRLQDIVVNDLKPSQWYHFRVSVQYAGTWVTSESKPFATLFARPSKPKQPSVYLILNGNDMFLGRNRVDPQIRLCWGPPNTNGQEINKYHVQVREFTEEGTDRPSTAMSFSVGNEESSSIDIFDVTGELELKEEDMANMMIDDDGNRLVGSKWRTKYCNLLNEAVLQQPSRTCKAWSCRLRALNSQGWSDFSDPLVLNHFSHPTLFKIDQPSSPRQLPPLNRRSSQEQTSRRSSQETNARDSYKNSARDSSAAPASCPSTGDKIPPSLLLPPGSPAFRYGQ
jgi:hypothetical protein